MTHEHQATKPSVLPALIGIVALLVIQACSSTDVAFKEQPAEDVGVRDVDRDAVTLGGADIEAASQDAAPPDLPPQVDDEGLWIPAEGDFVMRDQQTGSLWNVRGQAFEGLLKGTQLRQVPSFNAFWFAWSIFYDGSQIWNRDESNAPGAIVSDDNCEVPCDEIRLACGGRDCIPALDHDGRDRRPKGQMVPADDAGASYLSDNATVLGVEINGVSRAYPHNILWWHEIYNDSIEGVEFTATLCPLTGSGIVFSGLHDGAAVDYGVSGNLYNSNLVMFDRDGDTLWSQMMLKGISGPRRGERMGLMAVTETTWVRWRQMHPDTLVASDNTGYQRDYRAYPYGDYRTNDRNTFRPTNPAHQGTYEAKDLVMGLVGDQVSRAYAFVEMGQFGDRVVINDAFESQPIVVLYEAEHQMALPFDARVGEQSLTFEGVSAP